MLTMLRLATLVMPIMLLLAACSAPGSTEQETTPTVAAASPVVPTAIVADTATPAAAAPGAATSTPAGDRLDLATKATPERIPEAPLPVAQATDSSTPDSGLTRAQRNLLASLPSLGAAPELRNETWLNSDPLKLAELRGQVVLLDMWTFG